MFWLICAIYRRSCTKLCKLFCKTIAGTQFSVRQYFGENCTVKILSEKFNSAVLTEIVSQAELCTCYGFIENFTYNLVHDPLKMAHIYKVVQI
jgi:hypothetical protein